MAADFGDRVGETKLLPPPGRRHWQHQMPNTQLVHYHMMSNSCCGRWQRLATSENCWLSLLEPEGEVQSTMSASQPESWWRRMSKRRHLPAIRRWTLVPLIARPQPERSAFYIEPEYRVQYTGCAWARVQYVYIYWSANLCVTRRFFEHVFLCMLYSSFSSNLGRRLSPPRRSSELSSQMTSQNFSKLSWDLSGVTVRYVVRRPSLIRLAHKVIN
jgi:hypothetical protein